MIFLSQERIAQMVLLSFVYGLAFGVIMDFVRLVRSILKPTGSSNKTSIVRRVVVSVFTFLSDIAFVLSFAVCALLFTYNMSGGVFRGVVYVMMALGIIVYSLSLGRLTVRSNAWISARIKKIIWKIVCLICVPLRKIKKRIIRVYTLTIGKKIDKIKKETAEEIEGAEEPPFDAPAISNGYKKEGRISLGGKGSK